MKDRDKIIAKWLKRGREEDDIWKIANVIEHLSFSASSPKNTQVNEVARYELSVMCSFYNEVYTENCLRNEALANSSLLNQD